MPWKGRTATDTLIPDWGGLCTAECPPSGSPGSSEGCAGWRRCRPESGGFPGQSGSPVLARTPCSHGALPFHFCLALGHWPRAPEPKSQSQALKPSPVSNRVVAQGGPSGTLTPTSSCLLHPFHSREVPHKLYEGEGQSN